LCFRLSFGLAGALGVTGYKTNGMDIYMGGFSHCRCYFGNGLSMGSLFVV
jgi:hypothetical protein